MNIRETVHESMKNYGLGEYADRARPVIEALEQRETEIVSNLIAFAVNQGLSREQAIEALDTCGLTTNGRTTEDPRIAEAERQIQAAQETLRELRGQ